jgi:hypothetical protein
VVVAGAPAACETLLAYAGAYQLTLSSTLAALGVELHSAYLGHPDAAMSRVAHLLLEPDRPPRTWAREPPGDELPVQVGRRRCLLDHLAALQATLADRWGDARVQVSDEALAQIDAA